MVFALERRTTPTTLLPLKVLTTNSVFDIVSMPNCRFLGLRRQNLEGTRLPQKRPNKLKQSAPPWAVAALVDPAARLTSTPGHRMRSWASALLPTALTGVCARASALLTQTTTRSLGRRSVGRARLPHEHQRQPLTITRGVSTLVVGESRDCARRWPRRAVLRHRPGAMGAATLLGSVRRYSTRHDENRPGYSSASGGGSDSAQEGVLAPWPTALSAADDGIGLADAVKQAAQWLEVHGVVDPEPSACELLAKAAGFRSPQEMRLRQPPCSVGVARPLLELSAAAWGEFRSLCFLRAVQHVPVQYLVGEWDFYGLSLEMRPPTLIPRPETEELVEIILRWLRRDVMEIADGSGGGGALRFLDVGSGTGAIGLALLNELPAGARCVAVDAQESAVHLSRRNAERTGLQARYSCFHAEIANFGIGLGPLGSRDIASRGQPIAAGVETRALCAEETSGRSSAANSAELEEQRSRLELDGTFDFVVSNPPYIPRRDMAALPKDVANHEDRVALDGGQDGLDIVRDIVRRCPRLLKRGGPRQLWMEVDTSHPEAIQRWLGLPVGLGGEGTGGGSQECQAHGVTSLEWMRDMSQRPRFVRLTFAEIGEVES